MRVKHKRLSRLIYYQRSNRSLRNLLFYGDFIRNIVLEKRNDNICEIMYDNGFYCSEKMKDYCK